MFAVRFDNRYYLKIILIVKLDYLKDS